MCFKEQMATNRTNIRLNRTLIILLGILLACLITLNAKSLYTADFNGKPTKIQTADSPSPKTLIDQIGKISFSEIRKKVSSLN